MESCSLKWQIGSLENVECTWLPGWPRMSSLTLWLITTAADVGFRMVQPLTILHFRGLACCHVKHVVLAPSWPACCHRVQWLVGIRPYGAAGTQMASGVMWGKHIRDRSVHVWGWTFMKICVLTVSQTVCCLNLLTVEKKDRWTWPVFLAWLLNSLS